MCLHSWGRPFNILSDYKLICGWIIWSRKDLMDLFQAFHCYNFWWSKSERQSNLVAKTDKYCSGAEWLRFISVYILILKKTISFLSILQTERECVCNCSRWVYFASNTNGMNVVPTEWCHGLTKSWWMWTRVEQWRNQWRKLKVA